MAASKKTDLHRLVDDLPDAEVPAARRFLEFLRHAPLLKALNDAPLDDEPETAEEAAAVAEARADIRAGRLIDHAEVSRRYRGRGRASTQRPR